MKFGRRSNHFKWKMPTYSHLNVGNWQISTFSMINLQTIHLELMPNKHPGLLSKLSANTDSHMLWYLSDSFVVSADQRPSVHPKETVNDTLEGIWLASSWRQWTQHFIWIEPLHHLQQQHYGNNRLVVEVLVSCHYYTGCILSNADMGSDKTA